MAPATLQLPSVLDKDRDIALSDLSNSSRPSHNSPYYDNSNDEHVEEDSLAYPRSVEKQCFFTRVVAKLLTRSHRSSRGRRKDDHDYLTLLNGELPNGVLKKARLKEVPRCRRLRPCSMLRRALWLIPMLMLMGFGFLHLLQVLIGGARLFWDADAEDNFLPKWGLPGHYGAGLAEYPTDATRDVLPISCHSHNDYWRRVPLFDALHWGCTGVEADVWLYDDELYVGHNTASLSPNRTFQSLYVNPLVALLDRQNPHTDFANATGHGVFDADPLQTLVLLVDFKTDGHKTWPYVVAQLEPLRSRGYLTHFDGTHTISRAVTVVGTGNTPFDLVLNSTLPRDIFFDAPLDKLWELPRSPLTPLDEEANADYGTGMGLDRPKAPLPNNPNFTSRTHSQGSSGTANTTPASFNSTNSYYASVSFSRAVGFVWRGHLSPRQMDIIRGHIRDAKRRGLKARYWETPGWPVGLRNHVWHALMKEGADVLSVDDLRAAAVVDWTARRGGWW